MAEISKSSTFLDHKSIFLWKTPLAFFIPRKKVWQLYFFLKYPMYSHIQQLPPEQLILFCLVFNTNIFTNIYAYMTLIICPVYPSLSYFFKCISVSLLDRNAFLLKIIKQNRSSHGSIENVAFSTRCQAINLRLHIPFKYWRRDYNEDLGMK